MGIIRHIPRETTLTLGCDPELFITRTVGLTRKRESIVGSEFVLPQDGITAKRIRGSEDDFDDEGDDSYSSPCGVVVQDGVQVELHPVQNSCREELAAHLRGCLITLQNKLEETYDCEELKISFDQSVRLSQGDLNKLSPEARKLNCLPSLSAYCRAPIRRNGLKYLTRSAGGHTHRRNKASLKSAKLVKMLDLLVGNTCVLFDRAPSSKVRRRVYGRAGEYRTPKHGLEYRVLSNFWLKNYTLMSMVFGLVHQAIYIEQAAIVEPSTLYKYNERTYALDIGESLMAAADFPKIEKAINNNDYDSALETYMNVVRPHFVDIHPDSGGLNNTILDNFDYFIEKGTDHWFTKDPLNHWETEVSHDGHGLGFENFLHTVVEPQRLDFSRTERLNTASLLDYCDKNYQKDIAVTETEKRSLA